MTTTNLGLTLPTVGADSDGWGTDLNTALTDIDNAFGSATAKAFDTTGVRLVGAAFTWTDSTTAAGTVASAYGSSQGAVTFATQTNAVTITNAYGVYLKDPVAGSHVTLSNKFALGVDSIKNAGLTDISGASAGQIKFPASQNASSDANTLDDYEEGTFTPIDGSGASLSFTAKGEYIKIGRSVWFAMDVAVPSNTDTNQFTPGGLPFTADATQTDNMQGAYRTSTNSGRSDCFIVNRNSTIILCGDESNSPVLNSSYSSKFITLSGTYKAAA